MQLTEKQLQAGHHAFSVFHRSLAFSSGKRPDDFIINRDWDALEESSKRAWCAVAKSMYGRAANMIQRELMDDMSLTTGA